MIRNRAPWSTGKELAGLVFYSGFYFIVYLNMAKYPGHVLN